MEGPRTLRAVRSWQEAIPDRSGDEGVLEAMLLTVGAHGYEAASVQEVAQRSGISRDRFHRHFGSKDECFAQAYEEAAARLRDDVLEAGAREPSWRLGFRAALTELLRFVAEQPLLAKALLLEVRAARGRAWAAHQQAVERFVAAVDRAREDDEALPSASPTTAGFMVGAIEESLVLEIGAGRAGEVTRLLPDLCHLVVLNYFGEDEAWLELRSEGSTAPAS
ncbi:MAG TPA: TetR/AcrR family transcriptional regulator [Solirubrobacterales bacterium]|nr:TetR/AcrR family transcriptional regulator [Solirubrobacterales bacterium]